MLNKIYSIAINILLLSQHWVYVHFRSQGSPSVSVGFPRGAIRVVHRSDGPAGRVGPGPDFAGFWRVGSGQHFGFLSSLLIISQYLNRYESSNTAFGLIDFLRYLIYNN